MAEHDVPTTTVSVTLELCGSTEYQEAISIRKQEKDGGLQFIVSIPGLIDDVQATLAADLLFEAIDALPFLVAVKSVKLRNLRFTTEGVAGIKTFLSIHAASVKHVSMNDLMHSSNYNSNEQTTPAAVSSPHNGDAQEDNQEAFELLALAFESSDLITLNLSNNTIPADTWSAWSRHTGLQQLILDQVEMDDESIIEFCQSFPFFEFLEDLHVVLLNTLTDTALHEVNAMLAKNKRLTSIRWANRTVTDHSKLPWLGLYKFAQATFLAPNGNNGGTLQHVVFEGSPALTEEEIGDSGLCGALTNLPRLRTLKLRNLGLDDDRLQRIVISIRNSRPPLEYLDLSHNGIQSAGVEGLCQLMNIQKIAKNIKLIALNSNHIDDNGAANILSTCASSKVNHPELHLKLDDNPFDCFQMAFQLAAAEHKAESARRELVAERDRHKNDAVDAQNNLRKLMAAQTAMASDFYTMQREIKRLRQEREALVAAFNIVGIANQVEEQRKLLDRLSKLESMVLMGRTPSPSSAHRRPGTGVSSTATSASPIRGVVVAPAAAGGGGGNSRDMMGTSPIRAGGGAPSGIGGTGNTRDMMLSDEDIFREQLYAMNAPNRTSSSSSRGDARQQQQQQQSRPSVRRATSLDMHEADMMQSAVSKSSNGSGNAGGLADVLRTPSGRANRLSGMHPSRNMLMHAASERWDTKKSHASNNNNNNNNNTLSSSNLSPLAVGGLVVNGGTPPLTQDDRRRPQRSNSKRSQSLRMINEIDARVGSNNNNNNNGSNNNHNNNNNGSSIQNAASANNNNSHNMTHPSP